MRILRRTELSWRESGIPGIQRASLWNEGLDVSAELCRISAGTAYPVHEHLIWEQMLVLEGRLDVDAQALGPGDYIFTRPGETHAVAAIHDSLVYLSFGKTLAH